MLLTRLAVRNFKRFAQAEIELGNPVVFIGANNSGKTTALQALALWDIGLKRWLEKRRGREASRKRPGVTINRRDLVALPVPDSHLLWRGLRVREGLRVGDAQQTKNILIDVVVDGVAKGENWSCGLEFDYANEESFYVRPLRINNGPEITRMPIPAVAAEIKVAFLPPMSGLAAEETRLHTGAINVRLGEGRTAEILRNLCYQVCHAEDAMLRQRWPAIKDEIHRLFGIEVEDPRFVPERGEITMAYRDTSGAQLDLSAAGRGLQQTLLLLAYMSSNPNSIVLIDEPDAHLEILRQRQIYRLISEFARQQASQLVVASHSEVVLNEAADRDVVVAFVGKPHRIDDRGSQVIKALKELGFEQYLQAEQRGWVLYLEGSTDLAILLTLGRKLDHPAAELLERPFVHYVENQPQKARNHFYGLRESKGDLVGFALFDNIDDALAQGALTERKWSRREIENYVCSRTILIAWARAEGERDGGGPLFAQRWVDIMEQCIDEAIHAMKTLNRGEPWAPSTKVSDNFLTPLFENFYRALELPNLMRKTDFHRLAEHIRREDIDQEVTEVLDQILQVSQSSNPRADDPV